MFDYGDVQIQLEPGGLWHRPNRVDRFLTACGKFVLGAVKKRDRGSIRTNHQCEICWPPEPTVTCRVCGSHFLIGEAIDWCPNCGARDSFDEAITTKMRRVILEHQTETADLYYGDDEEPTLPGDEGDDSDPPKNDSG